jgi:hypothetical protein
MPGTRFLQRKLYLWTLFRWSRFPDLIVENYKPRLTPAMQRWFLSYTFEDFKLTQALKVALQRKDPV